MLGEYEKITPYGRLRAATLGAAFQLHGPRDRLPIEAGQPPTSPCWKIRCPDVDPLAIRDIGIWVRSAVVRCSRPRTGEPGMTRPPGSRSRSSGATWVQAKTALPAPAAAVVPPGQNRRIAVLVNDFGDIGIDGDLIASAEGDTIIADQRLASAAWSAAILWQRCGRSATVSLPRPGDHRGQWDR